jgi:hypothetical protein
MPRWPKEEVEKVTHFEEHMKKRMELEGKETSEQGETFGLPQVQEESTAEDTGLPMNDTNILVRSLSNRVDDLSIAFARMIDAINGHMPMSEVETGHSPIKLKRRRTEDEMRNALRIYANNLARQRDDESEDILNDTIGEVLALRQITMDLMQAITTAHQNGLMAIRKLTER